MNIEILSCEKDGKVEAIKIIREATGWGLKECKEFIDATEQGCQILYDATPDIAHKLKAVGVNIRETYEDEDQFEKMVHEDNVHTISSDSLNEVAEVEKEKIHISQANTNPNLSGDKYTPIVESNMIQKLDRESTMSVLVEVGKIAQESEEYDIEIAELARRKDLEIKKAEELRTVVSTGAKTIIWLVTIIAALVGLSAGPLCIVTGLVAFVIMNLTVKQSDLRKHAAENNANAENYIASHVVPIQGRLDEVHNLQDELKNCGKIEWAEDVVGKDLFYSACIHDLYDLLKNRRADNLKEALNKYDDAQYKQRMEEMQEAIQNASEISAREAVKQTAYSQETAKSAHQTATAAKATAYHTRKIDKNVKKIARK